MTWIQKIRFYNMPRATIPEQGARSIGRDVQPAREGLATDSAQWSTIELPKISDVRGNLSVIESERSVPFNIERIYYVYNVPHGVSRAGHAHKSLHQLLLAPSGSFTIHLDNGVVKTAIALNRPHIGLYIRPGVWRVVDNFSDGAVCLVLASAYYDETDYIRSYTEFETYIAQRDNASVRMDCVDDRPVATLTHKLYNGGVLTAKSDQHPRHDEVM
jgi:dTDP-4-dehydrorhamnose 3,5-epimerase-like enzyme